MEEEKEEVKRRGRMNKGKKTWRREEKGRGNMKRVTRGERKKERK